ncbi:hypothetical protein COI97_09195 [Bacillus cereus]|nr:hypothetical protein COI97_09195 [Bacillus cereus]
MNKPDVQEMIANLTYLQELLNLTFSDVYDSYEVLENYDDDIRYTLSLNYLSMSHKSYLEFKRVYLQNELYHYEIEPLFRDYEHYRVQLKEVITKKDSNTSWLYSAMNKLTETKKNVDDFLSTWIKNYME